MRSPSRAQQRRIDREVIERKRLALLATMDDDLRQQCVDMDYGTLVALKNSGRLNMLPGMGNLPSTGAETVSAQKH